MVYLLYYEFSPQALLEKRIKFRVTAKLNSKSSSTRTENFERRLECRPSNIIFYSFFEKQTDTQHSAQSQFVNSGPLLDTSREELNDNRNNSLFKYDFGFQSKSIIFESSNLGLSPKGYLSSNPGHSLYVSPTPLNVPGHHSISLPGK